MSSEAKLQRKHQQKMDHQPWHNSRGPRDSSMLFIMPAGTSMPSTKEFQFKTNKPAYKRPQVNWELGGRLCCAYSPNMEKARTFCGLGCVTPSPPWPDKGKSVATAAHGTDADELTPGQQNDLSLNLRPQLACLKWTAATVTSYSQSTNISWASWAKHKIP